MSTSTAATRELSEESRPERELPFFEGPCCLWQRDWTEEEFLRLDQSQEPHFFEYKDGQIDFPGWPTLKHQRVLMRLRDPFSEYLRPAKSGEVVFGVCPIRLWPGRWACPDLSWHLGERLRFAVPNEYFDGASGVAEVLENVPGWRELDTIRKRHDYAKAGIPEYWIVDPERQRITVLTLDGDSYRVHGEFPPGQHATSVLLPGFQVDVSAVFAVAERG